MKRAVVAALGLLLASDARADVMVDKASAEALFLRAKELEKQNDFASACPLYENSFRADPQLGALLNLANCHEQIGKLATAWAEFREAYDLARRRDDSRTAFARNRADALAERVSWLVIRAPAITGLVVRRDENDMTVMLGQELPIDPGTYRVSATAPGRVSWSTTVEIREHATHAAIDVPVLSEPPAEKPPLVSPPVVATATPSIVKDAIAKPNAVPAPSSASRVPLVLGGAGIIVAGTGLAFGARAFSKWNASRDPSSCDSRNVCNANGEALIATAKQSATLATYFVAGGGALITTAVVWWAVSRSTRSPGVEVAPQVSPGAVGLSLSGDF